MKNFIALLSLLLLISCNRSPQTTTKPIAKGTEKLVSWNRALQQKQEWYSSAEAVRIAENVLAYQHPNGGWHKNINMAQVISEEEKAALRLAVERDSETTIDNRTTFTQMKYLAKVHQATGQEKFKKGFLRGLDFLLEAQYENGGWPQFYPIKEGYYEYITFNDGAMIGVMELLRDVTLNKAPYTFVDTPRKKRASLAIEKGLDAILKTQIRVNGKLTAWCAQHDHRTFAPQKARAYELVSLSGGESIGIVQYLMELEQPSPEVIQAVKAAISWMEAVKLTGIRIDTIKTPGFGKGYDLVVAEDASAPPLLARFYEIETNRPMFVNRDGIVREKLSELTQERRSGYSWYIEYPQQLIEKEYPAWKMKWASKK